MPSEEKTVLIVEPFSTLLELAPVLRQSGWQVETCSGLLEAFAGVAGGRFCALVVHEDGLPETSQPLEEARELCPELTIVAAANCHKHVRGAHHSLVLPCDPCRFLEVLDDAYERNQDTRRLQRIQDENKQLKSILLEQSSRLSAVVEASGRLGEAASSLDLLCRTALDLFGEAAQAERLSLMVLEQNGQQELRIAMARGLPDEVVASTRLELGQGVAGWVAQKKRPLLSKQGLCSTRKGKEAKPYRSRSFISMPLAVGSEVIGVINIADPVNAREFTNDDVKALCHVCQQTALWLSHCRKLEHVKMLSMIDELTCVYNRRYLMDSLKREVSRTDRTGSRLSLALLDIDYFKAYNDTHGHPAGDRLLKRTARALQDSLRSTDIVCRYGGDEFAVILPEAQEYKRESLCRGGGFVDRFRTAVSKSTFEEEQKQPGVPVTVSGGVARCPEDANEPDRLIEVADEMLYEAKRSGRNKICSRYRPGTARGQETPS